MTGQPLKRLERGVFFVGTRTLGFDHKSCVASFCGKLCEAKTRRASRAPLCERVQSLLVNHVGITSFYVDMIHICDIMFRTSSIFLSFKNHIETKVLDRVFSIIGSVIINTDRCFIGWGYPVLIKKTNLTQHKVRILKL